MPQGHEYCNIQLFDELKDGTRIRRVETVSEKSWYTPTKKMLIDQPIFFYYELSKDLDKCYRCFRWARPQDKLMPKTHKVTSIAALKQLVDNKR